ncbi:MAG: DNA mismatch repair protein MutS, partial [Chloroflexi bacterium]|nr:DNA mismatch repair protein MutS [Chloroflexota bacterium]
KVFGYYIEVTRPNLAAVPADYTRRQTLVNAERFITPALKEQEARILTAEARIADLEGELFRALLRRVGDLAGPLVEAVETAAELDFQQGLAELAVERQWVRPSFQDEPGIAVQAGRHPVLEGALPLGEFVPNECRIGDEHGRVLLVTGPNMAGKSTYLRQVALIVLLAQVGSFVPAQSARIGLVDRIFTRVGSHDDLAAGASTFLVEMAETANILRHATPRSLVILDEVGRGTSTHDGLCIARAVVEHLHDVVGALTLFATHYHELTALAADLDAVRNVTVAVDEADEHLTFLYRVVDGAANRSYGVQVARLAGLPVAVTVRAAALLANLEQRSWDTTDRRIADPTPLQRYTHDLTELEPVHGAADRPHPVDARVEQLLARLIGVDVSDTTPLQALVLLHQLQQLARPGVTDGGVQRSSSNVEVPFPSNLER